MAHGTGRPSVGAGATADNGRQRAVSCPGLLAHNGSYSRVASRLLVSVDVVLISKISVPGNKCGSICSLTVCSTGRSGRHALRITIVDSVLSWQPRCATCLAHCPQADKSLPSFDKSQPSFNNTFGDLLFTMILVLASWRVVKFFAASTRQR